MRTLIKNIKELVGVEQTPQLRKQGKEMAVLQTVKDAYLVVEDGLIKAFGKMDDWKEESEKWGVERPVSLTVKSRKIILYFERFTRITIRAF